MGAARGHGVEGRLRGPYVVLNRGKAILRHTRVGGLLLRLHGAAVGTERDCKPRPGNRSLQPAAHRNSRGAYSDGGHHAVVTFQWWGSRHACSSKSKFKSKGSRPEGGLPLFPVYPMPSTPRRTAGNAAWRDSCPGESKTVIATQDAPSSTTRASAVALAVFGSVRRLHRSNAK
jgi:hypothetical protein